MHDTIQQATVALTVLGVLLAGTILVVTASPPERAAPGDNSTAPPGGPDHGVNNTTFWKLWSGDSDQPDRNATKIATTTSSAKTARELANASDFVFDSPPGAVETWNAGEHAEWNRTGPAAALIPPTASPSDGDREIIVDAYIELVSVGPSTIVHHQNRTVRYIGPSGRALAIVDYRIAVPDNETVQFDRGTATVRREVSWRLVTDSIGEEWLRSNRTVFTRTRGEDAPVFAYQSIPRRPNGTQNRTLTAGARITATLVQINRTCPDYDTRTNTCDARWTRTRAEQTVTHEVSDAMAVRIQRFDDLEIRGYEYVGRERAGVRVDLEDPWRAIVPTDRERVRSSWWFYTRQRPGWSEMDNRTALTTRPVDSEVRPLEVHAFPAAYGATVIPNKSTLGQVDARTLSFRAVRYENRTAAPLPPEIAVQRAPRYQSVQTAYITSREYPPGTFASATVEGVVRGTSVSRTSDVLIVREVGRIDVDVLKRTEETLTLEVVVWGDVSDGRPTNPVQEGVVTVAGTSKTIEDTPGLALEFTVPRRPDLTVRYTDPEWEFGEFNYANASTAVRDRQDVRLPSIPELIRLGGVTLVLLAPLALLLYGVDRVTQGRLLGREDRYQ